MLQKSKTKNYSKYKYLAVVPILFLMIAFSSFSPKEKENPSPVVTIATKIKHTKVIDSTEKNLPFSMVEKIPLTENCKYLSSATEMKQCVSEEIKNFVSNNFNVKAVLPYAKPGINRIYVLFKIDETGIVKDIKSRSTSYELTREAERVISLLPKMTPGESNGKKVGVLYSLPIVFEKRKTSTKEKLKEDQNNQNADNMFITETISSYYTHDIKSGFYLITNVFKKRSNFLDQKINTLKSRGITLKSFRNPKDNYYYVYLEAYNEFSKAKEALTNYWNSKYNGDLFILKINGK